MRVVEPKEKRPLDGVRVSTEMNRKVLERWGRTEEQGLRCGCGVLA